MRHFQTVICKTRKSQQKHKKVRESIRHVLVFESAVLEEINDGVALGGLLVVARPPRAAHGSVAAVGEAVVLHLIAEVDVAAECQLHVGMFIEKGR